MAAPGFMPFQIGHGQNVFHLTPLEQICPLKNFEVGLQTPPLPQTPYIAYEKGKNWKFEFYSCSGQNVFQLT